MAAEQEYREKISSELEAVRAEINELEAKADQVEEAAREKFNELVKNLHTSMDVVHDELMELVETEAWDKLKERMHKALTDLREAVSKAAAQCK